MTKETMIHSPNGLSQYLNGVNFRKDLAAKNWPDQGQKKRFEDLVEETRQQMALIQDRTDIQRAVGEQFDSGSIGMGEIIQEILESGTQDISPQLDLLRDRLNEFKRFSGGVGAQTASPAYHPEAVMVAEEAPAPTALAQQQFIPAPGMEPDEMYEDGEKLAKQAYAPPKKHEHKGIFEEAKERIKEVLHIGR